MHRRRLFVAIAAAGVLALLWGFAAHRRRVSLDPAFGVRFTAGRLAGQNGWTACRSTVTSAMLSVAECGRPPVGGTDEIARLGRIATQTREAQRADSSARTLHTVALLQLRLHDRSVSQLVGAVDALERARRLEPADARLANDLGVAYEALAERTQRLDPMLRALDAVESAMALDSTLVEASFNRALFLETLYLYASAQRAWTSYLTREHRPDWRADGERHRARITRLLAPHEAFDAQRAREHAFAALAEWGKGMQSVNPDAASQFLDTARAIGGMLDSLGLDHGVALAVRAIDSARDPRTRVALAKAHVLYMEGFNHQASAAYDDAVRELGPAEAGFQRAGSSMARWSALYHGAADIFRAQYDSADARLRRVIREAGPDEPAISAKAEWLLGVSQLRRGAYDAANRHYAAARPRFQRAREQENEGAIAYLRAEGLNLEGQVPAGQAEALLGLRELWPYRVSGNLNNLLTTVAAYARDARLYHASYAIMNEVLDVARALGRPQTLAFARRARARDLAALGRATAASADLDSAMHWAGQVRPGRGQDRVRADILLVRSRLLLDENPRAAVPMLSSVADAYRKLHTDGHLAATLYDLAMAQRATRDTTGARRSLDEAIAAIERQQTTFENVEARATFYEAAERVFDAMTEVQAAKGASDSAFVFAERGRMADWRLGDSVRSIPSLAQVSAELPRDAAFIEYAVLRDRVFVWTVGRGGIRWHSVSIQRDSVAALADRFIREADETLVAGGGARARLYDLFVRPVEAEIAGASRLVIIPDRELSTIPLAALWDSKRRRYLIESFELHTLPSVAFLARPERPRNRPSSSVLVVGDPQVDPEASALLPPLPGAAREARRVAAAYGGARLLSGAGASRAQVLQALPAAGMFHFAGHAVANADQPELSYLALAAAPPDEGVLRAREIGALRLSNLRLVVLSACSSLNPRPTRGGPVAGLAYSFLRAGVQATVSTLWDIGDEPTTDVLVAFHRRVAAGVEPAAALREAQVEALRSGRAGVAAPRVWAPFVFTGM